MTNDTNCSPQEAAARAFHWCANAAAQADRRDLEIDFRAKAAELRAQPQGEPVASRIAALERDLAEARAEVERLRSLVNGSVKHIYQGLCPDGCDWTIRDPECPACQLMGPHDAARSQP